MKSRYIFGDDTELKEPDQYGTICCVDQSGKVLEARSVNHDGWIEWAKLLGVTEDDFEPSPIELTKEMIAKYIKTGGMYCPFCQSDAIRNTSVELGDPGVQADYACESCRREWKEKHKLVSIEAITYDENDDRDDEDEEWRP